MKKSLQNLLIFATVTLALAACTVISPPSPYLPPKEGIVPGKTITVGADQNVYGVAQQYQVQMRDVIVLNDLKPPFAIKPGQQLILPTKPGEAPSMAAGAAMSGGGSYLPPAMGEAAAPVPGSAAPMGVEQQELPPVEAPPPQTQSGVVRYQNTPQAEAPTGPPPTIAGGAPSAEVLTTPSPQRTVVTTASPQTAPAPAPTSAETPTPSFAMVWPVQGPVLSNFGPKGQGLSNDGVNIGAPKGAPVVAAGNGIVVYAGSEMKGFGNLVLIRHQGGWVTAYAHLDRILIAKDSVVAQGDEIGTVGKTGDVGAPQLHFETRYGGKPVDPAGLIKQQ